MLVRYNVPEQDNKKMKLGNLRQLIIVTTIYGSYIYVLYS